MTLQQAQIADLPKLVALTAQWGYADPNFLEQLLGKLIQDKDSAVYCGTQSAVGIQYMTDWAGNKIMNVVGIFSTTPIQSISLMNMIENVAKLQDCKAIVVNVPANEAKVGLFNRLGYAASDVKMVKEVKTEEIARA